MTEFRYLEFTGVLEARIGKAWLFQADWWKAPQFIPVSQSEWNPEGSWDDDDTDRRGTLKIAQWLCKKNGWTEVSEPWSPEETEDG